jgi:hypothetical protein
MSTAACSSSMTAATRSPDGEGPPSAAPSGVHTSFGLGAGHRTLSLSRRWPAGSPTPGCGGRSTDDVKACTRLATVESTFSLRRRRRQREQQGHNATRDGFPGRGYSAHHLRDGDLDPALGRRSISLWPNSEVAAINLRQPPHSPRIHGMTQCRQAVALDPPRPGVDRLCQPSAFGIPQTLECPGLLSWPRSCCRRTAEETACRTPKSRQHMERGGGDARVEAV